MRISLPIFLGWLLVGAAVAPAHALGPKSQRFAVISNAEVVGELEIHRERSQLTVDYHVDDNGRGPQTHERIDLGPDGLPIRWRISGRGETGVRIKESFERTPSRASWRTRNDQGSARVTRPLLYLANDASPYAYVLYAQALLGAPQRSLSTLPSGSIRAEQVPTGALDQPDVIRTASVWALWGLGTSPTLVLLGADGEFLGILDTSRLIIPDGWRAQQEAIVRFAAGVNKALLLQRSRELVHRFDRPVHLKNVRVLDPLEGTLSDSRTVIVFRGRITEVVRDEAGEDHDAVVFDGEGGVLMPALIDMHAHLEAWDAPLYLAAGITTVRDMGNDNRRLLALMADIDSGDMMGPRVLASGFLEGRSPFSARDGFVVGTLPDALEAVGWYGEHGYWQIKLYNSLDPDWVPSVAREAHRLGMRVAGHVPAFMSSERAIRDGYDEITHLNQLLLSLMIDPSKDDTRTPFRFTALGQRTAALDLDGAPFRNLLSLMKEHGTALDPTAAILSEILLARAGEITPVDSPWIMHMPAPIQRARKAAILDIPRGEDPRYRASERRLIEALRAIHDAGIRIVPGTDDMPGFMLQSELETWQRAGIAPREILKLATVDCARYLGIQDLGIIERGKRADIMLLASDPTQDVHALRQIRLVMKDGAIVFPEEVHAAMQIERFASRPPMLRPQKAVSAAPHGLIK
jgi:hypothetical protein